MRFFVESGFFRNRVRVKTFLFIGDYYYLGMVGVFLLGGGKWVPCSGLLGAGQLGPGSKSGICAVLRGSALRYEKRTKWLY